MVQYGSAQGEQDLRQILQLQQANLAPAVTPEEALEQGFVTVVHDLSILTKMNTPYAHTVARENDQIVGYALSMTEDCQHLLPILVTFFQRLYQLNWQGRLITNYDFILMGQICVAKPYRGQGVFAGLYQTMQERMAPHFQLIITEISARNTRSLRAHEKVGFAEINRFTTSDGENWVVVGLGL